MSTLPNQTPQQINAYAPQETITGVVERLTFYSEESGYTVARLTRSNSQDLTTIVGSFANIQPGQTLQLTGFWRDHPQYGPQFQVTNYKETKPATLTGIEKYLGSGLIKGVGPVTAKRIVAHFGTETLEIIENQIERLIEVNGIAKKRIKLIQTAWETQKAIKEVMIFLQGHGVSTTYAVKIYKQYGDKAIATVTHNPYQLATDIYGIGFMTADKIARNLGVAPDSEFRYRAGLIHALSEAAEDGHCYLPQPELIESVIKLLTTESHEPTKEAIAQTISDMALKEELIREKDGDTLLCYKPTYFHTEQNLAQLIHQRLSQPIITDIPRVQAWLERFTATQKIELSPRQQFAVETAAYSPIMILTGGPGVGKTFTTHAIVSLWKAMGKSIALAAPTGRAAQRLSEMTGLEAKTIHRLLEFDPKTMGFKCGSENPLPQTAIIVDEASMLDLFLAYSLVKAVSAGAQLLLVGDIDQLPSVGPGNVLADLINSGKVPVVRLTQVFRQAQQSAIITAAHEINRGQYPTIEHINNNPVSDCLWHGGGFEPEHGVQTICELITDLIPRLGFNPATDVQVLCPMTRGLVGTRNLNNFLQELINPKSPNKVEITRGGMTLRVGDRVIQQTNDYQREVFNGDLGIITAIDTVEQEVNVQYGDRASDDLSVRSVVYDYADLNEITLAWSVSIHKSQGSEYPVVILPLYMQHYMMLSRNLLYTGLTRAKKLAIVIGSKKAISLAVRSTDDVQRYTRLQKRLDLLA
ncbi:ATP-dependent RecD-like DNA helicase [Anabaena cylindrica FACHB-243]|uniref:ATP-dependent RecD2 DNA helicase n=1 Tax=Anabaena cylindrica (strain ATCC 27899 / PCC 7122) TaxID=272123 RepID=K9ZPS8_ANACC|nr:MULTISPECIES: ATP-dependent RecD-like DNA helicase [Anabaena]AFZ61213.1 helicase, RecD/TraA family [Anabaena cylindrica PCC 7122]MBD2421689.1 ATP-dependent RecD-like DNA helicase [Anabaena cylindrica FACHB-243]MBY5280412.1 ATP-dependent RecD-like DNA helicase [Anabaena sp. CCAP 1446/1C]MBY5308143.1 ATP-dependent RecD-like DNA helicase [Anabaena sp. CCAP 1446/1C]MCM2405408.1 ATP-dependent RecD-like DNA helicase [Anabaena sp. CCAP 1446/1C]